MEELRVLCEFINQSGSAEVMGAFNRLILATDNPEFQRAVLEHNANGFLNLKQRIDALELEALSNLFCSSDMEPSKPAATEQQPPPAPTPPQLEAPPSKRPRHCDEAEEMRMYLRRPTKMTATFRAYFRKFGDREVPKLCFRDMIKNEEGHGGLSSESTSKLFKPPAGFATAFLTRPDKDTIQICSAWASALRNSECIDCMDAAAPVFRGDVTSNDSCAICWCALGGADVLRRTTCNHMFCAPCIERWLSANVTCPVCKADLGATGGYRNLDSTADYNPSEQLRSSIANLFRHLPFAPRAFHDMHRPQPPPRTDDPPFSGFRNLSPPTSQGFATLSTIYGPGTSFYASRMPLFTGSTPHASAPAPSHSSMTEDMLSMIDAKLDSFRVQIMHEIRAMLRN